MKGKKEVADEIESDPRRSGVAGGDVIRDCAVIEYVPFLPFLILLFMFFCSFAFLLPPSSSRYLPPNPYRVYHIPPIKQPTLLLYFISHHPYSKYMYMIKKHNKLMPRLPPVLCDPLVAKAHYDKIEKEVEEGVRQSQIREKAFGSSQSHSQKAKEGQAPRT